MEITTKHTKEPLEKVYISGCLVGLGIKRGEGYYEMVLDTILPDTDEEYEKEKETIEANCQLWKTAPEILTELIKARDLLVQNEGYKVWSHIINEIDEVIKKATE